MGALESISHFGQATSRYRIIERVYEGGIGVVYKAEDTKLERTLAPKFLAAHLLNDEEAKQRFLREAERPRQIGIRTSATCIRGQPWQTGQPQFHSAGQ